MAVPNGGSEPSFYDNPFRSANVTPERVDMGVDYAGSGPIYALGPGVITEADHAWLGAVGAPVPGTFITEKITKGPLAGRFVYAAEDINPDVSVGDKVDSTSVIAHFTSGQQLETGYASGRPGETMAAAKGQAATGGDPGEFSTAYGVAYNDVLKSVGAQSGIINRPITGTVPKTWPKLTGSGTVSPTQNAQLTSILGDVKGLATLTGDLTSADFLERAGLVFFGGILVIVGIIILALPGAKKATAEVGSAARSFSATGAAIGAIGGSSGGPTEEEKADRQARLSLAQRNVEIGEAKVQNVRMREERLSLGKPAKKAHPTGREPNPNPVHS